MLGSYTTTAAVTPLNLITCNRRSTIKPPLNLAIVANNKRPPQNRRRQSQKEEIESMGGLGHSFLSVVDSNRKDQIPKQKQKHKKENEEEEGIRGSDVLWALQRAATQKQKLSAEKKKKKKQIEMKRESSTSTSSSSSSGGEAPVLDYRNVRAIIIKREWVNKLDDLEVRLKDLEQTPP